MSKSLVCGTRRTSVECRKFTPNIFNKSKCSNCFKPKEEHSAEALESSRAARKISKCGYLFVAPGWDFSNPINRTKRWQRRWFVLYDDGELTYSVDEHPETVPQARIDMNRVFEVTAAEDFTGHTYSIAITSLEGVTFIKGTGREEIRWWVDVLQVYSRNKGRHKRNATFPGDQSTVLQMVPTIRKHERKEQEKPYDIADSLIQSTTRKIKPKISEPTKDSVDTTVFVHQNKLIRGDPDGCGLDISSIRYSPTSELRISLPIEDLINIKKGWLMKQNLNMEWNKYWFVLQGCELLYYQDPDAEDKDIMDGIINLNTVTDVTNIEVTRNYGFQTLTWDDRGSTILSAITAGIRLSWISAIRRAVNLSHLQNSFESHTVYKKKQNVNTQSSITSIVEREKDAIITSTTLVTPRSILLSSDEEYRTASEGGRRESGDWSEIPVFPTLAGHVEWSANVKTSFKDKPWKHEWSELPPSPPLTRTALSKVKARSQSNSHSRIYKRIRNSPLTSRHSSLDSIKSEDFMMACNKLSKIDQNNDILPVNECFLKSRNNNAMITDLLKNQSTIVQDCFDNNESSPNSLLVIVEHQEDEINNLKSQLNTIRTELVKAENKISKFRQYKTETLFREKQINELLETIQNTEKERNKYLDNLDKMKKFCNRDKEFLECKLFDTESILQETTERCQILRSELSSSHIIQEHLQAEVTTLNDRLAQGIEENERLYSRVRELEDKAYFSSSRERGKSFDSLSDLTNIDLDINLNVLDKERIMDEYEELKGRFEKAILEIRAMRKELREAHAMQDAFELQIFAHKQEAIRNNKSNQAQIQLMAARIQDLTNKLASNEKQIRSLKLKLNKVESRDKRRSLSLKEREVFQISQEVENKLLDLENRICTFEQDKNIKSLIMTSNNLKILNSVSKKEHKEENRNLDINTLRRKSLDSVTRFEPMKVLIRLNTLETKVINITDNIVSNIKKNSNEFNKIILSSTNEVSLKVLSKLRKLERIIAKSKRRIEQFLESIQAEEKVDKCLQTVNEIFNSCVECEKSQVISQITELVIIVIPKLESILRKKMSELMKNREQINQIDAFNDKKKVKLITKKVAFKFIFLKQIKYAMERILNRSIVLSELVETSQLISNLKFKINETKSKKYQNTSVIQYLTRVLANKLVFIRNVLKTLENETEFSSTQVEGLNFLLHKQREVGDLIVNYKNEKLRLLAEVLTIEIFSLLEKKELSKQTTISDNKLIEDKRIKEAWVFVQELIQIEILRFIMHCSQIYHHNILTDTDNCLIFHMLQNIDLKSWSDKTQTILTKEMQCIVQELTFAYKECLIKLKKNKNNIIMQSDSRLLLSDFTNVIAQKALIDARIILLQESMKNKIVSTGKTFKSSLMQHEDIFYTLFDENYTFKNNSVYGVQNAFLYQQISKECEGKILNKQQSQKQIMNIAQTLIDMSNDIAKLKKSLKTRLNAEFGHFNSPKLSIAVTDWDSIYNKCFEIREQIKQLTNQMKNIICKQCEKLQNKIQCLTSEHTKELKKLKKNQEKDLIDIKEKWKNQKISLTVQYEHEVSSLQERVKRLEYRLNAIDSEHSAHVNELRAVYQRSVGTELDTDAKIRKRYKEEIKQLRVLCEKGLLAMENSHRRIISELEEKHHHELENLRIEKEQALSEETQATLAALDVMRKAHEHEVQKEIAKFKQEFIKQVQAREVISILHKEHQAEMEKIKQEILSLSTKYSSKCIESAALEEKLSALTKQVAQAQQHIIKLDVRNKLQTHLVQETSDSSFNNTIQFLKNKDNELTEKQKKIYLLRQQVKVSTDDAHYSTRSLRQSTALSYSPIYSLQEMQSNHKSITEANSLDEILHIEYSKNSSTHLKKRLSTKQSNSLFLCNLERVKSESFLHSNNIVVTQSISNKINNENKEVIKVCNGVVIPLWNSLKSRSGLPLQYQGTKDSC